MNKHFNKYAILPTLPCTSPATTALSQNENVCTYITYNQRKWLYQRFAFVIKFSYNGVSQESVLFVET
jgi:hypothetical protein